MILGADLATITPAASSIATGGFVGKRHGPCPASVTVIGVYVVPPADPKSPTASETLFGPQAVAEDTRGVDIVAALGGIEGEMAQVLTDRAARINVASRALT